MAEYKTIDLESLVGEHMLDGCDMLSESIKTWRDDYEDCEVLRFRLDGVVYTAVEDPSDGYRSSLYCLFVSDEKLANSFPAVRVLVRKKPDGPYGHSNDTIEMLDIKTGKIVLEVGTDNSDDYYPSFVSAFHPENMSTNAL